MSSRWPASIIRKNPITPAGPNEDDTASGVWSLSEAMYWKKQGLWPTQGVVPTDPYFPYVTMLLSTTSLGNANNNLFVDSSGAFNPIRRFGNTTQGSATPYGANWSNYFDGSGDNLKTPSNAAFAYGTGDFTWEMWVFPTSSTWTGGSSNFYLLDHGSNGGVIQYYANVIRYYNPTTGFGTLYNDGGSIPANTWTHIAIARQSGTTRLFVNGVLKASQSDANNYGNNVVTIADYGGGGLGFPGYISNVRIVKGTAVYTSAFTPPTSALTAISGTSLLTCQSNRFRDASTNNFTITAAGNTLVTDFAPFSPGSPGITYNQSDITNWSGYFDGSGDYLSAANNAAFQFGTGDFTVECWINKPAAANGSVVDVRSGGTGAVPWAFYVDASNFPYFYDGTTYTSSVAITTNAWNHIAVVRTSGTLKIFVNGVQGYSQAHSVSLNATGSLLIGGTAAYTTGYISNLRIVKGTAVYTGAFTPPTTNLTAISGTSLLTLQNAAFTDNSTNNFVISQAGQVTVTGNSPFNTVGYWSNYFSGSGTYLSIPSNAAFAFDTGDFTVEGWIFVTVGSLTQRIVWFSDDRVNIDINSSNQIYFTTTNSINSQTFGTVTLNTWVHFAVSRTSGTVSAYLNGVRGYTGSYTSSMSNRTMYLGVNGNGNGFFNGYMSNIRMLKGTGLYSGATITVPTAPLTAIANTSLLTCQNARIVDNSTNALSFDVANASVQSFDPFYTSTIASNGGSMYFDGATDYLNAGNNPSFAFGTGNFTVECWFYTPSTSTSQMLISTDITNGFFLGFDGTFNFGIRNVGVILGYSASNYLNAWNHVAVSRSGSTISMFFNGTRVTTTSNSTNFSVTGPLILGGLPDAGSYYWNGYIANARITNGTAVYDPSSTSITVPTAPLTPTANTVFLNNGMNAGLYDATAINDMETVSGAQVVTNISKFGGSSAFFNGTGGFLDIPAASSKDSAFGTGDFTVEMWLYFNSVSGAPTIITFNNFGSGDGFFLNVESSAIGVRADGSTPIRASTTVTTGVWYHVAVTRSGGTLRLFQDGVNVGSATWTTNCTAGLLRIGQPKDTTGATYAYSGYMDDLRVTKGIARYTSNFTPPTKAFPLF